MNSYQQAIRELASQRKFHIKLGLERVSELLAILGNPHQEVEYIHVAGTNGKGSTCCMLASVLKEAGYTVGLYTSPHLIDYTERMKVNGIDISKGEFAEVFSYVLEKAEQADIPVTEFEILTVMAFEWFKRQNVDFAVLETGLGGRLDATNVVKPVLSVITSIDIDHADRLGDTIEQIAFEKAGIVKNSVPVVVSSHTRGLNAVCERAEQINAQVCIVDEMRVASDYNGIKPVYAIGDAYYKCGLGGVWQRQNVALVLESVAVLRSSGCVVSETALKAGIANASWPARFQYFEDIDILLDGAHNPAGARLLKQSLDRCFPDRPRIWVYSSIGTKDYCSVMRELFSPDDIVVFTKSGMGSAVEPSILKEECEKLHMLQTIYTAEGISNALSLRREYSKRLCIIAGSLYTAGEFLTSYNGISLENTKI